jgi:hypothetical protein
MTILCVASLMALSCVALLGSGSNTSFQGEFTVLSSHSSTLDTLSYVGLPLWRERIHTFRNSSGSREENLIRRKNSLATID